MTVHFATLLPILVSSILAMLPIEQGRFKAVIRTAILIFAIIITSQIILNSNILNEASKLDIYLNSAMYGYARNLSDIANIRAILLLVIFLMAPVSLINRKTYSLLLSLYACGIGIRIGFLDVAIISGRLGSIFGFAEIFLIPLLVQSISKNKPMTIAIGLVYFLASFVATAYYQVPGLIDDYFRT
jgi:hypothetical protein